jgi:hypothetical protein
MTTEQPDEATILHDAQRRLEANRQELERERQRELEVRIARADRATERSPLGRVAAAIGRGVIEGLAGAVCRKQAPLEPLRVERERELLERIPARFRDHSLENPSPFIPADAARTAREWLDGKGHLLTIGSAGGRTGSGKTTLAGMTAVSAAHRGIGVLWVHASELNAYEHQETSKAIFAKIVRAPFVVIDGLGKEIAGASDFGADVVSRRKALAVELIQLLHERRGPWERKRIVITSDLTNGQIAGHEAPNDDGRGTSSTKWVPGLYGPDALRRLCAKSSGATVIVLHRKDALDVARF